MKVISPTEGRTRPSPQGLDYLKAATPDFSGLVSGLNSLGASIEARTTASQQERDRLKEYNSQIAFNDFETGAQAQLDGLKKNADPAAANFPEVVGTEFTNYENKFIESLDPNFQEEYRVKTSGVRQKVLEDARVFDLKQRGAYYEQGINKANDTAKQGVEADRNTLEQNKARVKSMIEASDLPLAQKAEMLRLNDAQLEGIGYRKELEEHKIKTTGSSSELGSAIKRGAAELGIDPVDLATVISYETMGKFSTSIRGGKDNKYIGLIQFGPAEQIKYGARQGQSYDEQMTAVVAYLKDRGFKPGMGLLDLYSTINAGSPGHYKASDRPGMTVEDHVKGMGEHQKKAIALLGGQYDVPDEIDSDPRYSNVSYEDRIAIRKQADANANSIISQQNAEAKAKQAAFTNQFKVGIFDGTLGQKDLDEARGLGSITDFEDIRTIQGMIDKRNKDGEDLRAVQTKFDSGSLWSFRDEDDNKIANTWFNEMNKGALEKGDQSYFDNILMPFVKITKMIPKDAINTLDAMSRQQGPTSLFALNALSKMHDNEPDAYEQQVPDEVQKNVDFWEARRAAGYDQKETLDLVGGRIPLDQRNAREIFGKQADAFFNDPANVGYFDKVLSGFSPDTFMPFERTATAPVWGSARFALENEWKTVYKENLIKAQGDPAIAEAMTKKQVERTWGTTDFGGRFTLMKFPPNKAGYNESNGPWIEDQARSELHIPPNIPMQLISDEQTQSDVLAGKPASYLVAKQDADGWHLATNADGQIIRQHFVKTPKIKQREDENFNLEKMKFDNKEKFLRFMEAAAHSQATGIPIPQEIVDDYNTSRAAVDAETERIAPKTQGPPSEAKYANQFKTPFEGPHRGPQQSTHKVMMPPPDVKTLEGYPGPALGMLNSGNIDLISRPVVTFTEGGKSRKGTVRSITIEENGAQILIPTIVDGKLVNDQAAIRHYQETGEHLGIFADENSAEDYAKKLSEMQGKRLGL